MHEVTLLQYQYRLALSDGVANAFRRKRRVRAVDSQQPLLGQLLDLSSSGHGVFCPRRGQQRTVRQVSLTSSVLKPAQ